MKELPYADEIPCIALRGRNRCGLGSRERDRKKLCVPVDRTKYYVKKYLIFS